MGVIAALPEPGLGAPFTAGSEPAAAPAAAPATAGAGVPATFRSEGAQAAAPRLGSLSLAAILAVSLAALRGIHSAVAAGRVSREQREAVAKTASTAKDILGGGSSKRQVQPGHEYGRMMLQRGPGGLGGRSGGFGPGRSGRGGSGSYSGSGGQGRGGSSTRSPSGSGGSGGGSRGGRGGGGGSGPGRSNSNSGSGGKGGSGVTPLRRTSQGGGVNLTKNRGPGSSGGSGGSGGGKGPGNSGGGGGRNNRGPGSGGGSGSSGGGSATNRRRGPGSTGVGGSSGGPGKKHGPGSGTGTGKTTGPGAKGPGKGTVPGGKTTPGTSSSKGPGFGKGTSTGPKSGTIKSPRGTTGPSGILRKKPGTTTFGTGPKTKPKGTGSSGAGTTAPGSKRGGGKGKSRSGKGGTGPASVPKAPGGKSRKGKKITLTPGIAHGSFAASEKYGCRCRKCRRFRKEYSRKVLGAMKSAARGRTTFGEAVHETAEKRLRRRRKKMRPPVFTKVKVKKAKKKTGPKTKATKPAGPAAKAPVGPAAGAPTRRTPWSTAKARARKRARMRTTTIPGPRPAAGPVTAPGPTAPTAPALAPAAAATGGATAPAPPGGGTVPGTGTPRLSPFEAMGAATAASAPATPITVERAHSPGSGPSTSGAGLPAGTPSTKENSVSTAPDLTRDTWMAMWGSGGIADMDAQHQTEVTLDDTLDVLEELTEQSFKAHETCRKLATKAREIRYELDELAADLRTTHNVIGRLTGAAMAKLAESMELLARKADEMAAKSLTAAELSESAENAMFDAYRPLQQATEDAGLAVPAARVHNEN
ncbi:hypothetical protein [Streptomyces sp. NPDC047071]|uniref:hypothetical protein n=1 Tax=Streptomyces sp. NPDC047071 TaxID=3154808 RepID=UPI00345196A0